MTAPIWILDEQWRELKPPAEVLVLGELPRAPEKILGVTRALCVTHAPRYQPDASGTKCNINTSDVIQILQAPLPHWYDFGDGRGRRELTANDTIDALRAGKFPGWSKIADADAVIAWVALGKPAVVTWRNMTPKRNSAGGVLTLNGVIQYRSGHINPVVPTPIGRGGVHVTGAGATCVEEVPLAFSFGQYVRDVEFWGHE